MRLLIFALCLVWANAVFAEETSLANLKSLKCQFPVIAYADWRKEVPNPAVEKDQKLAFQIDGIDVTAGKARIVATAGAEDLKIVVGQSLIHFLEATPSGNVNITTVYNSSTKDGRYKAVHSRHMTMIGGPLPSQSYGFCQP